MNQLPPEGTPPRRRFFLHVPGRRDDVELKQVERVDRADGWGSYLVINDASEARRRT